MNRPVERIGRPVEILEDVATAADLASIRDAYQRLEQVRYAFRLRTRTTGEAMTLDDWLDYIEYMRERQAR